MPQEIDYKRMYDAYRAISKLVHSGQSTEEVLDHVVRKSTEVLNAKGALLRILNPTTRQFEVAAATGLGEWYLNKGPVSTEAVLSNLEGPKQVVVIGDLWQAPRVAYPQEAWNEGIRMMLDVPLSLDFDIIGLLRIYLAEKRDFYEEEKNFMVYIAEQCACALNRMRFIESQRDQYHQLAIRTEKLAALGRMAAGIAHEINNPLAGILLFSSNLIKKVPPEGPLQEGLDVIIRESQRCKTIIQELLNFSREREPQKNMCHINEMIEKALYILENEFKLKRIRIEKHLDSQTCSALMDENQIEQVFVNLLINAVHAVDEEGLISVETSCEPAQRQLRAVVADNGCGIPPESIGKIFDPFFSTKKHGTGLGLAVSYGIIQNHQGRIDVASTPGEGTRFVIELPLAQEE